METLVRFRLMAARLSIGLTLLLTLIAYAFGTAAAKGMLAGGLAGTLVFWWTARRIERLAAKDSNRVHSQTFGFTALSLGIYAFTLWWSFNLDRDSYHGLIAAAIGLFIVRIVLVVLGITGLDLKKQENESNGNNR